MTSQIAIFNLNGIAVASDTVATQETLNGNKTTHNNEKIYPLGEKHHVIALNYGSSGVNDLQLQFHFNRWRESLLKPLPKIEDYLNNYVKWASKNALHAKESEKIEIASILSNHFSELLRRTQHDIQKNPSEHTGEFLLEKLLLHVKKGLDYLKSLNPVEGITLVSARQTLRDKKIDIKKIFFEATKQFWAFESLEKLPPNILRLLKQSAPYALIGRQPFPWDANLAFIGFGTKDNFGSSVQMHIRCLINNKLIFSRGKLNTVKPGTQQARIIPFAQDDAIQSFVQGYNEDIMDAFTWAIESKGREILPAKIADAYIKKITNATQEYVEEYSSQTYITPMLRQIAGMNLFSMSELVRTLVGVQATSSEAKDRPVSVGGLIEVLTIDRINGVQWRSKLP